MIGTTVELYSEDSGSSSLIWSEFGELGELRTVRQISGTQSVGYNHYIGNHRSPQPHLENNSYIGAP